MKENRLKDLENLGQDLWLDFISRSMIISGDLARRIENDGLAGVTSNPTIFEKSIDETNDYDNAFRAEASSGKKTSQIARSLMLYDITAAADQFRTLYERSHRQKGYVSIEVSPHLAHNTGGTIREAQELWHAVNRPNILVKVPATTEGLPAIRELISRGINVNITLLFGLPRYREVTQSFIDGINARIDRGDPVSDITSVASFFLSRIDASIDQMLETKIKLSGESASRAIALKGKLAIASATMAYGVYKEVFKGPQFAKQTIKGARPQRLLWASTSTKNPTYPDTMYVDPLIAPETISTQPAETIEAYREHGKPALRIDESLSKARGIFDTLASLDINIDSVTARLEREGVEKFSASYGKLIATLEKKQMETSP